MPRKRRLFLGGVPVHVVQYTKGSDPFDRMGVIGVLKVGDATDGRDHHVGLGLARSTRPRAWKCRFGCATIWNALFDARIPGAMDRVMPLRARVLESPEVALARQRTENDRYNLQRSRTERLSGLDRLTLVRHGPVRHISAALVVPPAHEEALTFGQSTEDLDPQLSDLELNGINALENIRCFKV
jgi:hypothetical protein